MQRLFGMGRYITLPHEWSFLLYCHGIWRQPNISEKYIIFIFWVEEHDTEETAKLSYLPASAGLLLGLLLKDGGDKFLRNGLLSAKYMALQPASLRSS
jgi:hypothetical protein